MTDPKKTTEITNIYCPECGLKVPEKHIKMIIEGKHIVCERCGYTFWGISNSGDLKYESDDFSINNDVEKNNILEQFKDFKFKI